MSDHLKLITVRPPMMRVLLVIPVALALLFSWYAVRWYIGDFVAEFAPQMEDPQMDAAQMEERRMDAAQAAMRLAPDDPWTHWVVAGLEKRSLLPGDLEDAARHY